MATIGALVLACACLGTASVLQGPRIQGAQLDTAAAVVAPASLRIVLDEAVAPLTEKDVTVVPATPVTVENDGDVVLVNFTKALDYDASYKVTLTGVHAAAGGVNVNLSHRVRTPPLQLTWLQRAPSGDKIVSGAPTEDPTTLFTAARIQDYLYLDSSALLVVTVDRTGASAASIVATDGSGNAEQLTLPGDAPGRIEVLELSGTNVLYTFTSLTDDRTTALPTFDQTLFRLDLSGTHISDPVPGVDGKNISADSVIPIPGTTADLIHARSGNVLRYDPTTNDPPTLVVQYNDMVALAGDRHRLSVTNAFGPAVYDLDDGSESQVQPSPLVSTGKPPLVSDVVPLRDGRQVEQALVPSTDYSSFDAFLAIDDGSLTRPLYATKSGGSLLNMRVTANERYLITETSPGGADFDTSDGYELQARPHDVTTIVIDLGTGKVVASLPGSEARWAGGVGTRS